MRAYNTTMNTDNLNVPITVAINTNSIIYLCVGLILTFVLCLLIFKTLK